MFANPTVANQECDCLQKVPGLDYPAQNMSGLKIRNYSPPEYPTVVYVPQRNVQQPQYANISIPVYQGGVDQSKAIPGAPIAKSLNQVNMQQQGAPSLMTPNNLPVAPQYGTLQYQSGPYQPQIQPQQQAQQQPNLPPGAYLGKNPCICPETSSNTNPKYLQEVAGSEFVSYFPNKKHNRKKINFEAHKDPRPKLTNQWQTEHRENFGFFSCASMNQDVQSVTGATMNVPVNYDNQPWQNTEMNYNPDMYQQQQSGIPYQFAGSTYEEPVVSIDQDEVSDSSQQAMSKSGKKSRPTTATKKEATKGEAPQLNETMERKSRGAYENEAPKEKKKTKQELYAEVYNKTMSTIQQKGINSKRQIMDRQEQYKTKLDEQERLSLERNQKELQEYMKKPEKAPFFAYGSLNTNPVSDKDYMKTHNVGPRNSTQVFKDVVARRERTNEYEGWKKLLEDNMDYKQWKPKSYYWKSFDRFDKYDKEVKKERTSFGDNEVKGADDKKTKRPSSANSKRREDRKATTIPTDNEVPEEENAIERRSIDAANTFYAPEEYQQAMMNNQYIQQQANPFMTQQQGVVNPQSVPYPGYSLENSNPAAKRSPYDGPTPNDLTGLNFPKFTPKDYSDFNPKNYRGLPTHYLNYIRPAGKITPSNEVISECFRFYD